MLVISMLLLPIIAANAVFRFLHTSSGATLVHSFPLSRRTLFTGSFLSGLILSFAPVVLTMLAILPLCLPELKPAMHDRETLVAYFANGAFRYRTYTNTVLADVDVSAWLLMFCLILLVMFFIYALAMLASSLTGMGSAQTAVSFVLNFLPIFLFLIVTGYLSSFLIGFGGGASWQGAFLKLNPLVYVTSTGSEGVKGDGFPLLTIIIYLVIAIAIIVLARWLYAHKKLERAGNPISFHGAEAAINDLVTLVGMAGMGMVFAIMIGRYGSYNKAGLILGCVLGAVIVFMVVTMLSQKTPRVFTRTNLKAFGVFGIIGVLFIAFTAFDLTGYTDRVPEPEAVEKAGLTLSSYPFEYPYTNTYRFGAVLIETEDPDELTTINEFHRGLIGAEKASIKDWLDNQGNYGSVTQWNGSVKLVYELSGGRKMNREYSMPGTYTSDEVREELAGMPAFRRETTLQSIFGDGYLNIKSIKLDNRDITFVGSQARELAERMDMDYIRLSASELAERSPFGVEGGVTFSIEYYPVQDNPALRYGYGTVEYTVTKSWAETHAWLNKNI